jgi:hydrogenase-4 component B
MGGPALVGELAWAYPVGTLRMRLDALGAFFLAWSLPMTLLGSVYAVGYLRPISAPNATSACTTRC